MEGNKIQNKQTRVLVDISFCAYGQAGIMSDLRNTIEALLEIPNLKVDFWLYSVQHNYDLMQHLQGNIATPLDIVQMLSEITGTKKDRLSKFPLLRSMKRVGNISSMIFKKFIPIIKISNSLKESVFRKYLLNGLGPNFLRRMDEINVFISPFTDRAIHYRVHSGISTGNFKIDTQNYDFVLFQTEVPIEVSSNTKKIVRHHDLIPFLMPDTEIDSYHRAKFIYKTTEICRDQNSLFICNSQKTQNQLLQVFPSIKPENTNVVFCAISPKFHRVIDNLNLTEIIKNTASDKLTYLNSKGPSENSKKNIDSNSKEFFNPEKDEYVLMVGLMDTRKNYKTAVKGMEVARREYTKANPGKRLFLFIAGSIGTLDDECKNLLAQTSLRGNTIFLEKPSIDDLNVLYSHARVFLFPSYDEGFGIPPIEAMRCGTPVISSDIQVHREIQKEAAIYFNPYDHKLLGIEICKILFNTDIQEISNRVNLGLQLSEIYTDTRTVVAWRNLFDNLSLTK